MTPSEPEAPSRSRAATTAGLELNRLQMRFRDSLVIDDLSLTVPSGQFVSVIGASGCGKTTLLNLVAGFFPPTAGELMLGGSSVSGPGADRVTVFQDDAVFPWASVIDNVAYGLRLAGLRRRERRSRAAEFVRMVGLSGHEHSYPHQLSGGMRKRVDVARALIMRPSVLLMDEPFAALDAITKQRLQDEFVRLSEERSTTTLFVTHDIEEALLLSDRVVMMAARGGAIVVDLTVPFGRPRTSAARLDPKLQTLRAELLAALELQRGGSDTDE